MAKKVSGDNLYTQLEQVFEKEQVTAVEKSILLEKALKSENPNVVLRARRYMENVPGQSDKPGTPKSMIIDPIDLYNGLGYKETPLQLSYNILRRMARTPLVRSVIEVRKDQVAAFSGVSDDDQKQGWTIRRKRSLFQKEEKKPTTAELKRCEELINFINDAGSKTNKWKRDDFDTFLRKSVKDSLELDQMTWEIVRNKKGDLIEYFATDGATYRITGDWTNENDPRNKDKIMINGCYPSYIQLYQMRPVVEFYPWELCFGIRNQSTQLESNGYGISELEDLIRVVTYTLYAEDYNGKNFSQGSHPKGILKVSGNISDSMLNQFRMEWLAMVNGIQNVHRMPIVQDKELEFIDMSKNNKDMEFEKWQNWLLQIICALFKIAPEELGFDVRSHGGLGNEHSQEKLDFSRQKGFIPLMKFKERNINKFLISELDEAYEFAWTGLTPEDGDKILEADIKKVSNFETLNEVRTRRNLPKMPDGDIVLNSMYMQAKGQAMMGNQESNQAVEQGQYGQNPYMSEEEQIQKSIEDNPMLRDLDDYVKRELQ